MKRFKDRLRTIKHTLLTTMIAIVFMGLALVSPLATHTAYAACADKQASDSAIINAPQGLSKIGCGDTSDILSTIVKAVFGLLTMLSILFIVIGGLRYTVSGGDSNAIASAKKTILYAVIGLVLGLSVFVIFSFVTGSLL